jgi:uncharacterized membrane protein
MSNGFFLLLTLLTALGSGLIAGAFFAFSSFVMGALGKLPPPHGIAAMQSINVEVINPWFLGAFLGTAGACAILAVVALVDWQQPGAALLLTGTLLYLVGTFLVTMLFNVPLNDALAAVAADSSEGASLWSRYLTDWTNWNHVRTIAALAAAALLTTALWLQVGSEATVS